MIPPKSPPKPKRSRNNAKPPAYPDDEIDVLIKDDESESAFQFDLSNKAELTSIEDLSGSKKKAKKSQKGKATEDPKVIECSVCLYPLIIFMVISLFSNCVFSVHIHNLSFPTKNNTFDVPSVWR